MWRTQLLVSFFFFNDTATTEIYTLSLHDALPIFTNRKTSACPTSFRTPRMPAGTRSEEHTSELQSRENLVCRLLLEKKKENTPKPPIIKKILLLALAIPQPWTLVSCHYTTMNSTFDKCISVFFLMIRGPTRSTLFPYTTLFR